MTTVETAGVVEVAVENIGGIERMEQSFRPGITILTGRNATNRTSFLRSLMAALGSDGASLKSDAERGSVSLRIEDETYSRVLERDGDGVTTSGDPYLDDAEVADLFAFLLESNEARRAVRTGADLRELIMRPVDTAAIESEIDRLEAEKRQIDDRLDSLGDLESALADLENERAALEEEIEAVETEHAEKQAALERLEAGSTQGGDEKLDEDLSELEGAREDLERTRMQLETERESLSSLREERETLEQERADLPAEPGDRLTEIEGELERLRAHKRSLESTINRLGQVIQFNEDVVEGENDALLSALDTDVEVTEQLLPSGDSVVCWTCGTEVEQGAIRETLDTLRSLRGETVAERRSVTEEIDELEEERRTLESRQEERERIEQRIRGIVDEIDRREQNVENLEETLDQLRERIDSLETDVQERDDSGHDEVLERQREVNELEFELASLREDLAEIESEIDGVEARLDERGELRERREAVAEELTEQRTRIDRLEAEVVETFNDHMADVLALLDYENIARVWIERRNANADDLGGERVFDLHVVRGDDSGVAYEDTVDHLSESEREVAGLVFALAGYLAHEVYETVPFMLLDSLEAIDSERIASLLDYFADHAPYLVVALLEEDASAVDDAHERIEMG